MSSTYKKIIKGEMIPGLNMFLDAESQKDRGVITLKEHFGSSICVNAMRNADTKVHNVSENKLRKGELSASVYSVGCYAIIDAVVLVKDEFPLRYTERIPADAKQIAEYKEFCKQWGFLAMPGFRKIQVIYAAYKYDLEPKWKYVCLTATANSYAWSESISFIGTAKKNAFKPNEKSDLFILVDWVGDSRSTETWYRFSHKGYINTYNGDSDELWEW